MNGYEIFMLVASVLFGINLILTYWCVYVSNNDRKKAQDILDKITKYSEERVYKLGRPIQVKDLLNILPDDQLIMTEFNPIVKEEYIKEYRENLEKEIIAIKIWVDFEHGESAIQFIGY